MTKPRDLSKLGGGFIQSGTGAVQRSVESKLKDTVSVKDFGAVGDGVADDTAAFNLALRASETYGDSLKYICLQLGGGNYRIDGTVYLRKGQQIDGGGAHLFMGATGSIKLGFKSNNTEDAGGAPPRVYDLWIEGGLRPIDATVSGYQVSNIFFSFPAAGAIFGGTDGTISDCIFDNGASLASLSGRNMTMTNCNFYVGGDQLVISDLKDSVVSNCVFNYANTSSLRWAGQTGQILENVRIDNCSFIKNEQTAGTFNGFVHINNVTTAPAGNLVISGCNFRNCAGGAIRNYGTSIHRLTVENCVFDGNKTFSTYAQSTTMFALDMATSGFSKGITIIRGCEFRNLHDTPIKLSSAEAFDVAIRDCVFTGNAGSQSISVATAPRAAKLVIGNCVGQGASNTPLITFTSPLDFRVDGWLKNWLPVIDDGVTNLYVEVPFVGTTLVKAVLIANQNPGGSSFYRAIKECTASATYDYTTQLATRASIQSDFASGSPVLGFNLNVQAALTSVATGTTVNGVLSPGKLIIYWPRSYGNSSIDVQYVHSQISP